MSISNAKLSNLARCDARTRSAQVKTNSLTSQNDRCVFNVLINITVAISSETGQC